MPEPEERSLVEVVAKWLHDDSCHCHLDANLKRRHFQVSKDFWIEKATGLLKLINKTRFLDLVLQVREAVNAHDLTCESRMETIEGVLKQLEQINEER